MEMVARDVTLGTPFGASYGYRLNLRQIGFGKNMIH